MGEEAYFIDKIEELLLKNVLGDEERDFNETIFYGADSKPEPVISAARRFPMSGKRQIVVLREAQELDRIEALSSYVKNPQPSTVFVICYKYGKPDGRKSLITESKKVGIVYESKKIYDNQMAGFIVSYMRQRSIAIDAKSAQMLADYLGSDINKLEKETDKLSIILNDSPVKQITPELIEKNIGISKDYNSYALINALATKDVVRANRIADYFDKNQKEHNPVQILTALFNYFANLMICLYSKDKNKSSLMKALGIQWDFHFIDYEIGMRKYSAMKVFNVIHEIRIADAKSKGFGNNSSTAGDIYKELIYKIIH
jgi:DNA polymerase-3 subunit delta